MSLGFMIAEARAGIDAIDQKIINLIQKRRELARSLMDARLSAGEPERNLGRETAVVNSYHKALGFSGAMIAERLLLMNLRTKKELELE